MNIKVIKGLTAGEVKNARTKPLGSVASVASEPVPGFIRRITLGPDGLHVRHGENVARIPLEELLALAEKCLPDLVSPSQRPKQAAAAEVEVEKGD